MRIASNLDVAPNNLELVLEVPQWAPAFGKAQIMRLVNHDVLFRPKSSFLEKKA